MDDDEIRKRFDRLDRDLRGLALGVGLVLAVVLFV